jgi:rfaE bifunctional protein kinase chain/domain
VTAGADLAALVPRLAGQRVLVAGDLVLDEYWIGRATRVSREAPVLVLEERQRDYRAGSAGSPAANVVALGSQAAIVGAVGRDAAGERLSVSLADLGVTCEGLVRDAAVTTATKMRVLAEGFTGGLHGTQQVLRLDRVSPLPDAVQSACAEEVARLAPACDAVLISDYRGGVASEGLIAAARASGKPVLVDSQGSLDRFRGVDLVKINHAEARDALGSDAVLEEGESLRQHLDVRALVITLGAEGIAVFSPGASLHIPALATSAVFDVTGAGDTVIAVLALGLVAGLSLGATACLANAAASLVVRQLGVATVTPAQLAAALAED